ncbi:MAG: histone deacetylase family protein [Pseudomonadota bacterium]
MKFITHPVFEDHAVPDGHPEHAGRIRSVWAAVEPSINEGATQRLDAPRVTREQLLAVHTESHVDFVYRTAPPEGIAELDHETTMGPASLEAFERAAGAVVHAVNEVLSDPTERVFCGVRPPGHHARSHCVAGFCAFNSIAVGAAHALSHPSIKRVAIVDFDVHHGDGTEEIFKDVPSVLACSTYQHPLYPDVNLPTVPGSQINSPLPAGTGGDVFRETVESAWVPEIEQFAPDLIMISAGFDAHKDDPLGSLQLTEEDFVWATRRMMALADQYAGGRVVAVLEGGYNVNALGKCAAAVVEALAG